MRQTLLFNIEESCDGPACRVCLKQQKEKEARAYRLHTRGHISLFDTLTPFLCTRYSLSPRVLHLGGGGQGNCYQGRPHELAVPLMQVEAIDADEETQQAIEDWHY